jgi:uncharacterized membrane protein
MEVVHAYTQEDIKKNKLVAALSYLSILFLIPLLLRKDSPFAQFHAKQGAVLFIAFFIGKFFFWIPILGWLACIVLIVITLIALVKTLMGEAWEVPYTKQIIQKLGL